MKLNKKSGFTLLEIIIVIIIVGVLASLALPRFFNTIEYSRSTEALNSIGILKRGADRCALAVQATTGTANSYGACNTFTLLGIEDPTAAPDSNFSYNINWASPWYVITAAREGNANAVITFSYNPLTGASSRRGGDAYSGLK
jgi:prepilin-type N-terminal cleavage/methylation domain-containing protein